jgi:hypothetical protein
LLFPQRRRRSQNDASALALLRDEHEKVALGGRLFMPVVTVDDDSNGYGKEHGRARLLN